MRFNLWFCEFSSKIVRHVAEGRNAQILGHELHIRMTADRLSHRLRQPNIACNHFAISRGSCMLQGKPHFEGSEATRVLRSIVDVVCYALLEMIVRRVVGERRAQCFRIAYQRATGFKRCVEPFMRINRDRIGLAQRTQIIGRPGNRGRKATIGSVAS